MRKNTCKVESLFDRRQHITLFVLKTKHMLHGKRMFLILSGNAFTHQNSNNRFLLSYKWSENFPVCRQFNIIETLKYCLLNYCRVQKDRYWWNDICTILPWKRIGWGKVKIHFTDFLNVWNIVNFVYVLNYIYKNMLCISEIDLNLFSPLSSNKSSS